MSNKHAKLPLVAIVGATGTGKSDLAIDLAQCFDGEIINSDALQLYRGLPIATNKVSAHARGDVRHHLLDTIELREEPWTVKRYCAEAQQTIREIQSRGRLPILIGGTHYYLQSLLFPGLRLNTAPEASNRDFAISDHGHEILESSTSDMYAKLKSVDPDMASQWHPCDRRKIRRSLEIWLHTGRPPSELYREQKERKTPLLLQPNVVEDASQCELLVLWTYRSPAELNGVLNDRVEAMVADGLLQEAQAMFDFVERHYPQDHGKLLESGLLTAIGYKEFLPFLRSGCTSEPLKLEGIERTKISTRQYAARQIKWLRSKFLIQMHNRDAGRANLFLLDLSDESRKEDIRAQALELVSKFLVGAQLPEPVDISSVAADLLIPIVKASRFAQECEICRKVLMTESEWSQHIRSKGHKRLARPQYLNSVHEGFACDK